MSSEKENTVMYIFVNRSLEMSPGKLAAQVSHAAVQSYIGSKDELISKWTDGSHTKITLQARDADTLNKIANKLNDNGLKTFMIIDEGRTEIEPNQKTALGVEVVDRDNEDVQKLFKRYQLLK